MGQLDKMCINFLLPTSLIRQTQWLPPAAIIPGSSGCLIIWILKGCNSTTNRLWVSKALRVCWGGLSNHPRPGSQSYPWAGLVPGLSHTNGWGHGTKSMQRLGPRPHCWLPSMSFLSCSDRNVIHTFPASCAVRSCCVTTWERCELCVVPRSEEACLPPSLLPTGWGCRLEQRPRPWRWSRGAPPARENCHHLEDCVVAVTAASLIHVVYNGISLWFYKSIKINTANILCGKILKLSS